MTANQRGTFAGKAAVAAGAASGIGRATAIPQQQAAGRAGSAQVAESLARGATAI